MKTKIKSIQNTTRVLPIQRNQKHKLWRGDLSLFFKVMIWRLWILRFLLSPRWFWYFLNSKSPQTQNPSRTPRDKQCCRRRRPRKMCPDGDTAWPCEMDNSHGLAVWILVNCLLLPVSLRFDVVWSDNFYKMYPALEWFLNALIKHQFMSENLINI